MIKPILFSLMLTVCFASLSLASAGDSMRSKELREFISRQKVFQAGDLSSDGFTDYISYLVAKGETYKVDLKKFPQLVRMMDIQRLQLHTDFDEAEIEGKVLLNTLAENLNKEDFRRMDQETQDYKKKKITNVEYTTYIERLAKKVGLSLGACPNFINYVALINLTENFKEVNLFKDIEAFNGVMLAKLKPVDGKKP